VLGELDAAVKGLNTSLGKLGFQRGMFMKSADEAMQKLVSISREGTDYMVKVSRLIDKNNSLKLSLDFQLKRIKKTIDDIQEGEKLLSLGYYGKVGPIKGEIDNLKERVDLADLRIQKKRISGTIHLTSEANYIDEFRYNSPDKIKTHNDEFIKKLGIDNLMDEGRKAIADAESMKAEGEADFATRRAEASLERGRQCYASLKGESQEVVTPEEPEEEEPEDEEPEEEEPDDDDQGALDGYRRQLKALTARMDEIDETIPEYQQAKSEYEAEWEEEKLTMNLHITAAQKAVKEASGVDEIIARIVFAKDYITEKLAEAKTVTSSVENKTADLNFIYTAYATAALKASNTANKVCDYASRAASQPSPTADEIAGWISESDGLITQASISLLDGDKEVVARTELLDADITRLRATVSSLEELSSRRNAILADFDQLKQIKSGLDDAEKDLKRAEEIKTNYLNTYVSEMERIQGGLGKDVKSLGVEADALAEVVRGKDRQLEAGVAQLQARIKAAAGKVVMDMPQRPPKVPKLTAEFTALRTKLEGLDAKRSSFEEGFALVKSAIADGNKAISDAEGVKISGAFATKNAPANLKRARECYASLKEAKETAPQVAEDTSADIEATLQSCDFEKARTLIDQMPAGQKKTGLEQKYQAAVDLENRLKALVEKASGEYKSRKYGDALSTLDKALLEAKCERHLESINKKIAIVNAAVLKVYNNAKAALQSCNFEKAKKFIDMMPAGSKKTELDQEYQAAIELENRLKALVNEANGEYTNRRYEDALSTLGVALDDAKCDRHIESINNKIALVKSKMGPAPEEQVAGPDEPPEPRQPTGDEETMVVDWEILKVDKYCTFSALWGKDLRESDTYWALFEIQKSRDEMFFIQGIEADRYLEYLIVHFDKEDRNKRLKRNDLAPHESYAKYYGRDTKRPIRVIALAETRAEMERLRDQQWSPSDRKTIKQSEKRLENLFNRIKEKMISEGELKGLDDDGRDYTKGSWFDTGMTYRNQKVFERFVQDIQTGKLKINLLKNGVVVDTFKLE
jgi:hypothetical protein